MESATEETEEVIEKEDGESEKENSDDDGGNGMHGGEPSEPDGEDIFTETENPVAEGLGTGVDSGAGAGLGAVGSERDAASKKGGTPTPLRGSGASRSVSKQSGGGRTNEGVSGIPDGVEVRNLVGEEFDEIKGDGEGENPRMGEDFQRRGKMDDAETLEEAESGDGGVEIQAGGKSGAKSEAEGFDRIHYSHCSKGGFVGHQFHMVPSSLRLTGR